MVPTVLLLKISQAKALNIGLTYINSYNADDTGTGSGHTFARFDDEFFDEIAPAVDVPTASTCMDY